nr:helix-turn-helix domain-containing protein [Pyrinomonadaceae bacterium]
ACILATGDEITSEDFLFQVNETSSNNHNLTVENFSEPIELPKVLEKIEKELIQNALIKSDGVQAEAARNLGISRSDIAYKIRKYNL